MKSRDKDNRRFGLLVFANMSIICIWWYIKKGEMRTVPALIAVFALLLAIVSPKTLGLIRYPVELVFNKIGRVITVILLALVYFLLIWPAGIIARIRKKDHLKLNWQKQKSSYWEATDIQSPSNFNQQF